MSILGRHGGRAKPNVTAGMNIDVKAVQALDKELAAVKRTVKELADELKRAADESGRMTGAFGGGGSGTTNGMVTTGTNTSISAGNVLQRGAGGIGRFFGGGVGTGMAIGAAGIAGWAGSQMMSTIDQRVDRNRAYALSASRAGVEMQFRTGMSEQQYLRYRQMVVGNSPTVNVDPTAMIGFENRTGISALQQRNSVGAIRALSGYSMGTQDVLGVMQQNLNPAVANRQFNMMGGLTMYGPGGQPRDYMSVLNARVGMFGLDNRMISQGAVREGSISRYRMGMAGISSDEQDLLIQLGQARSSFRERGGKGTFDPTNREHRRIAGVEETFASQFDESERLQTKREEDMFRKQTDNYAALERSNQTLIKSLNSLENTLSGIIGARTSARNWMNLGGRALQGIGAGLMLSGVGVGPGAALFAGGAAISGGSGLMTGDGDPGTGDGRSGPTSVGRSSSANDDRIKVPYGYGGKFKTLSQVKQHGDFQKLHPTMQSRLLAMMRDNPNVGIGDSHRDPKEQEAMFLDRYRPDPNGEISWQGKKWKRVKGAPAAPPGRSMHEIGLASDLVGDLKWVVANAHKYGLKHFADVNNEPWHVQPAELPNSRRKYEEMGAPWGTDPGAGSALDMPSEDGMTVLGDDSVVTGDTNHRPGSGVASTFTGMTIQQIVDTYLSGGIGGAGISRRSIGNTSRGSAAGSASSYNGPVSSGAMAAARAAFKAGFRGQDLATIVAIAGRESGWESDAINRSSNDTGMWQIAPINFGNFTQQDLLNVDNNAQVAWNIFQSSGWKPWRAASSRKKNANGAWVVDPSGRGGPGWASDGDHMWNTGSHVAAATAAANQVMSSGDPIGSAGTATVSRAPVSISNNYHIEFSPVINVQGNGTTPQLRQVAQETAGMLREQVELAMKRSN